MNETSWPYNKTQTTTKTVSRIKLKKKTKTKSYHIILKYFKIGGFTDTETIKIFALSTKVTFSLKEIFKQMY